MNQDHPDITLLQQIVSAYQERSYDQEIQILIQKGNQLTWILQTVQSDALAGIQNSEEALNARRIKFGSNAKEKKSPPGICHLLWEALKDFTLRILMVAACISIIISTSTAAPEDRSIAWIDGFAILVAVFVCVIVSAVNDYQKQRQFTQLNSVADSQKVVTLRRQGLTMTLHQDYLLVGDVVAIVEGMQIPADGILLQSNEITTDQSAMTGQAEAIIKATLKTCIKKKEELSAQTPVEETVKDKNQIPSPIMMSGTKVMTGQGRMLVMVVGEQSCIGKLRLMLQKDDETLTPLQQKLEKIAQDIGKFGIISAIIIVLVLLIRFGIQKGTATLQENKWDTGRDLVRMLDFLILGVTVVVVAIPEGLPLSVTLSLAFSVKKMLGHNNLVRRMQACETMGGANNICSDKTGTLTLNLMSITQIWNGKTQTIETFKSKLQMPQMFKHRQFLELFKMASLVNSSAELEPPKGSSTQLAFLQYFQKLNIDYRQEREKYKIQIKYPFSSSRKRMSIIIKYNKQVHLFTKGASQIILQSCTNQYIYKSKGQTVRVQSIDMSKAESVIHKMAQNSLRTLCLAYKQLSAQDDLQQKNSQGVFTIEQHNLTLIAIVGVRDIPRKEVPEAIRQCHQAGITVRMVTGDNIITARAIANDIGLLSNNPNAIAMEGPTFSQLVGGVVCSKCKTHKCDCPINAAEVDRKGGSLRVDTIANGQQFQVIMDNILILARSRPEDKYCLVTALKERGNVVAVTGDGTNDAPALKKADVGFAMGLSGTQVARDAASIILIDDNFSSIVKAVLWGRNIYDSIRKFIQFQLTVNVVAVVITLIGAALIQKDVLKPIQMLWVNLIMDTLASLALATQEPDMQLLKRKPHGRSDNIVSKPMLKHIVGQSIVQIIILLIIIFMGQQFLPEYADGNDIDPIYILNPQYKWHNSNYGGTVCSGRFYAISGGQDYETAFQATKIYSRHFTYVFNTFVMLQIFDFLNARKLNQELNIFSGITNNLFFPVIMVIITGIQIILISFAGYPFGVYNKGLTPMQWLICTGFGAISLIVGVLIKFIPVWRGDEHSSSPQQEVRVMPEPVEISNSSFINTRSKIANFDSTNRANNNSTIEIIPASDLCFVE